MRLINSEITGVYTGENIDGMVREYMRNIGDPADGMPYVPNKTLYTRKKTPGFGGDKDAEDAYWAEQIHLWRHGEGDMPGIHHTYFNHMQIRVRSGGRINPEFRRHDMVTFDVMESMAWGASRWFGDNRGKGVIELGKRGSGKSNRLAAMQITVSSLQDASDSGMTANSEQTVKKYMDDKPKFLWASLPEQLRATAQRNSQLHMWFGEIEKDSQGNDVRKGRDSSIICRSPTANAFESLGLRCCSVDEAPKTQKLRQIFDNTDPCLASADGFSREGFWWITGVAGDFDKHGQDFIEMWDRAEALDLIRVFIPGWAGMEVDAYGNEDVERAVRMILEQRSRYKPGTVELYRRIQQYPLTPEECFLDVKEAKMPTAAIRQALQKTYTMPTMYRTCELDFGAETPKLIDNALGSIQILEAPQETASYASGVDPFGYKMNFSANNMPGKNGEGSSGALVIRKARVEMPEAQRLAIIEQIEGEEISHEERLQLRLSLGGLPVLRLLIRPQNPDAFARVATALIRMYGWRSLVERVPSNVIEYMLNNGMADLLFWEPFKHSKTRMTKSDYSKYGMKVDEYWAGVRLSKLYSFYERYADWVYFPGMLEHALNYNPEVQRKKFDDLDADGMALIMIDDPRFTFRHASNRGKAQNNGAPMLPFSTRRS